MSFDVLGDLNWLAVIVAWIAFFLLGALWFAPFGLGKVWQDAGGWTAEDTQRTGQLTRIGAPLLGCLVSTVAIAMLAEATDTDTAGEGIVLGLVASIGLVAAELFVSGSFDPRKPKAQTWVAVTAGYYVVGLALAGVIVAVWT